MRGFGPACSPRAVCFVCARARAAVGWGWGLRDAARVVLRLARTALMQLRLREARQPVCAWPGALGGA